MAKRKDPVKKIVFVVLALFLLCSCGYQLVREKGIYGGDISSIYIPVFKNLTYEPNLSQYVTYVFSKELLATGLFTINKEGSDGYLDGTITRIAATPTSMSIQGVVIQKYVTLYVDIALRKNGGGLVKRWSFADSETYYVENVDSEEFNKKDAIQRLSARIARRLSAVLMTEY